MKESFYFTHDFNAHGDPKIRAMRRKWKLEGYGVFWVLIEMLAQETGRWYMSKDYEGIADEIRTTPECVKSIIEEFGLFEFDDENFWNKRLDSHFKARYEKSQKASASAKARWSKHASSKAIDANASKTQCESDAIKERKGKEKKQNNSKTVKIPKQKFGSLVLLTKEEHEKILESFGETKTKVCLGILNKFLENPNKKHVWKKYKSHYHVMIGWVSDSYDEKFASMGGKPKSILIQA